MNGKLSICSVLVIRFRFPMIYLKVLKKNLVIKMTNESLIEYGDNWNKIEERTIEFYALMMCCTDYPIRIDNYSYIDELRKADDFEDTMQGYRELARGRINFNGNQLTQDHETLRTIITDCLNRQRTKLGQNAVKEIIENYNNYLLNHNSEEEELK